MEEIKREFNKRVDEINQYFDFLEKIEYDYVIYKDTGESINARLRPTLRANTLLLLYNLLESTIIQAIDYIHIAISTNDTLFYYDAIDAIKKIWIEYKYDNFKNQNDNSNKILSYLESMPTDIIVIFDNSDSDRMYLNKIKGDSFAGNIDARKVRSFAEKYGFKPNRRVKGENLIKIKQQRNKLAHGELSFRECGNSYTFGELEKFKKETFLFLREFLCNVEKYISNKEYRKI